MLCDKTKMKQNSLAVLHFWIVRS